MSSVRFSVSLHSSLWPAIVGGSAWGLVMSLVVMLKCGVTPLFLLSLVSLVGVALFMGADMVWESESGEYSLQTFDNLKFSLCLLVWSEVMLFLSLLWSYFHYSLSPSIWGGSVWPLLGITTINPVGVPLFSTLLLVSSGITITWSHHLIMVGSKKESLWSLAFTVLLGVLFLLNQLIEFTQAPLTISDGVLGSIFFSLTGFHGFHVMMGVVLLVVSGVRLYGYHFSSMTHTLYELSIWYWHLVDCVWLFVYTFVYWWGS